MDARQAATFAAGAGVGASLLWCWMSSTKRQQSGNDKDAECAANGSAFDAVVEMQALGGSSTVRNFDQDDILSEHLTRNVQFFGMEGQKKIANSFVVVVGLGVSAS